MTRGSRSAGAGAWALVPAGLGAGVFLACHGFFALTWDRLFESSVLETAWFLGSKTSIVTTQAALGVAALALAARAPSWRRRLEGFGLMTAGVMVAVAGLFFAIGPGRLMVGPTDLWPVVLVSALLLLAPAILAGTLLGGYWQK